MKQNLITTDDLKAIVDKQAEDDGLWFMAETASEAYLQQELRKLHGVVEGFLYSPLVDNGEPIIQ